MEPVYRGVEVLGHALFALQGLRFDFSGTGNIPSRGGAVLVINHTAYVDPLFAGLAARKAGRWLRFMAKREVFEHPLAGPVMRGAKQIPVDRDRGGDAMPAAVRALRSGEVVGVYPEGTISRSFELKEFKTGAARMAAVAGVPMVPVVVWGAQRIWTKGGPRNLGRTRTPIRVIVGPPMTAGADHHRDTAEIRARMAQQLEQAQRGYGPHPQGEFWVPARLGGGAPTREEAARIEDRERSARTRRGA